MPDDHCPHCGEPGLPVADGLMHCVDVTCDVLWAVHPGDDPRYYTTFYAPNNTRARDERARFARTLSMGTRRREGER